VTRKETVEPDNTAVRVALWRALHVQVDAPPHVFEDEVGLKIVAPGEDWRSRPDMSSFTRPFLASILARARFIDDLVAEKAASGVTQYVIDRSRSLCPEERRLQQRNGEAVRSSLLVGVYDDSEDHRADCWRAIDGLCSARCLLYRAVRSRRGRDHQHSRCSWNVASSARARENEAIEAR
jgi:hypothetical protein